MPHTSGRFLDFLVPPLEEEKDMALQFGTPALVTFSRNNTYLSNAKDENEIKNDENDIDIKREVFSRAASRNLSRASLRIQTSAKRRERDKRRIVSSAEINFDEEFQWDSDEGL